jgi:hypothetical protein
MINCQQIKNEHHGFIDKEKTYACSEAMDLQNKVSIVEGSQIKSVALILFHLQLHNS